jgi:hypothetical protein
MPARLGSPWSCRVGLVAGAFTSPAVPDANLGKRFDPGSWSRLERASRYRRTAFLALAAVSLSTFEVAVARAMTQHRPSLRPAAPLINK